MARWLEVKDKEFYYIMTAADKDKSSMETTLACFRGYADCVNGAKEMGVIYGTGVYERGKILNTPAMAQAYEMGKMYNESSRRTAIRRNGLWNMSL